METFLFWGVTWLQLTAETAHLLPTTQNAQLSLAMLSQLSIVIVVDCCGYHCHGYCGHIVMVVIAIVVR